MSLARATRALVSVVATLTAGCGGGHAELPEACRAGPTRVSAALERAPRAVAVGGVRLSSCFTEASDPGDIQALGATYVSVAGDLADAARERPEGAEAVRLGYLVGAAQRGAAHTQGIHSEMTRRLEAEPAGLQESSSAYRRGRRAGRRSG